MWEVRSPTPTALELIFFLNLWGGGLFYPKYQCTVTSCKIKLEFFTLHTCVLCVIGTMPMLGIEPTCQRALAILVLLAENLYMNIYLM